MLRKISNMAHKPNQSRLVPRSERFKQNILHLILLMLLPDAMCYKSKYTRILLVPALFVIGMKYFFYKIILLGNILQYICAVHTIYRKCFSDKIIQRNNQNIPTFKLKGRFLTLVMIFRVRFLHPCK